MSGATLHIAFDIAAWLVAGAAVYWLSRRGLLPLTSLIPQEHLLAVMPNTISPEKYPVLREKFVDLFSLSSGPLNTSDRVAELLCCLPSFHVPEGLSYENIFRVTIVQFLDRFNFCIGNVKRSCIHFVTAQGAIIPFDTYNLFYRNGAINRIRAGLAAAAKATSDAEGALQGCAPRTRHHPLPRDHRPPRRAAAA